MAVVRNLMIRIGADFSAAKKGLEGATRELNRFRQNADRTTQKLTDRSGLGRIGVEFEAMRRTVSSALSQLRGSKGIGGVASALGSLRPTLFGAAKGFQGLGASAAGAGASLGAVGVGLGVLTAALAAATVGLYQASQTAAQFEADIGRLNVSLRDGARGYMDWARAQGLAKTTAAELGATYGNLLGSFISDSKQLQQSTQDLVHATRVIASYTGRSLDDVFNRIRSGMLGSTEAIEDLGVYVNISMIESTEAFRKFAGDKSWSQLTFQQQQQIRLAAILEQTYKRYGNQVQQNVMTKQERLLEQLKDIKLHLSQAFLPIWDSVLPALTRLAESISYVTEQIARFVYWLRGWDYDERTSGMDQYTDSIQRTGDAFDEMGDKAKKARSELAAFDRLNLLGFGAGGTGGKTGGGGGQMPEMPQPPTRDRGTSNWIDWLKNIPRLIETKFRITFDPPVPPDAGLGAVVTSITNTVNQMAAQVRERLASMWAELGTLSLQGMTTQQAQWSAFSTNLGGVLVPALTATVVQQWANMWNQLQTTTVTNSPVVQLSWQTMLENMRAQLGVTAPAIQTTWQTMLASLRAQLSTASAAVQATWKVMLAGMVSALTAQRTVITTNWNALKQAIESIRSPLAVVKENWTTTLTGMALVLTTLRPQFELNFKAVGLAIRSIIPELDGLRPKWSSVLSDMYSVAMDKLGGIVRVITDAITAWNNFKSVFGAVPTAIANTMKNLVTPPASQSDLPGRNAPVVGYLLQGLDYIGEQVESSGLGAFLRGVMVPGASVGGTATAGSGALTAASKYLDDALKNITKWFKDIGIPVPAFAAGGIVSGPTLAMVGEYPGAATNPEVIAPLSDLESMMDNSEQTAVLRQILRAIERGQTVTVTISEDEIAQAAINGHNKRARRLGKSELLL